MEFIIRLIIGECKRTIVLSQFRNTTIIAITLSLTHKFFNREEYVERRKPSKGSLKSKIRNPIRRFSKLKENNRDELLEEIKNKYKAKTLQY